MTEHCIYAHRHAKEQPYIEWLEPVRVWSWGRLITLPQNPSLRGTEPEKADKSHGSIGRAVHQEGQSQQAQHLTEGGS